MSGRRQAFKNYAARKNLAAHSIRVPWLFGVSRDRLITLEQGQTPRRFQGLWRGATAGGNFLILDLNGKAVQNRGRRIARPEIFLNQCAVALA